MDHGDMEKFEITVINTEVTHHALCSSTHHGEKETKNNTSTEQQRMYACIA